MLDKQLALPGPGFGVAAEHATDRVPMASPRDTVGQVLAAMRGRRFDSAAVVAVCEAGKLVGLVMIERLLAAPRGAVVADVMDQRPPTVGRGTDQEHAAWEAVHHGEPGLAVVDQSGRFVGVIRDSRSEPGPSIGVESQALSPS